jgi:hypothetical protein
MPKQLITVIGLVVSLGIIALGVVLVAVPMLLSSFAVDSQTASVAASNDVYQAQVDGLEEQEARQGRSTPPSPSCDRRSPSPLSSTTSSRWLRTLPAHRE